MKRSCGLEKGALIKQSFTFNGCVWSVRGASSSEDLLTSPLTSQLLLWWYTATLGNRNPIHEQGKKRKRWFKTHPERVTAPRGTSIFPPDQKTPVISSWKQKDDLISDLISLTLWLDLSPPHLVLLFLVSSGMMHESKPPLKSLPGKENILFLEKFLFSQSGCLIYMLESDEGWSYSKACLFLIGLFFA